MTRIRGKYPVSDRQLAESVRDRLGPVTARKLQYNEDLTDYEAREIMEQLRHEGYEEHFDFEQSYF